MKQEKTIFCTKITGHKILEALRSEKYVQGRDRLENNGTYCCLGVIQMALSGQVEKDENGTSKIIPSWTWLKNNGISFKRSSGESGCSPYLPLLLADATIANDGTCSGRKHTFLEIAEAMEQAMEFTDENLSND